MESVKIRVLEIVEYWSCCVPDHRHTTEVLAVNCNSKRKCKPTMTHAEIQTNSRFAAVESLRLFLGLESYSKLSKEQHLSPERVRQKVCKGLRIIKMYDYREGRGKSAILANKDKILVGIDLWKLEQISLGNIINKRGIK